ncbi:hypothetical protein F5884DRAFT_755072 [Xylogone sp. PMI_703]|nr:hypothetical protein F5884DRAFT_755072 [Xylogone sp. PMI_703]
MITTVVEDDVAAQGQASTPAIDPNLKPSTPTLAPISYVDTSLGDYDRFVLRVGDEPFFFNGIQLRADKLRDVWGYTESKIKPLYQQVADDGFTAVNTQIFWSNIQPDKSFNASESTYIRGGSYSTQNFASSTSNLIGYQHGTESNKELTYIKFDFSSYTDSIDAAKVRTYVDSGATNSAAFQANLYGITNNSWSATSITWVNAPNHNVVDIAGTEGADYFLTSSSPSWDLILSEAYYDFDVSDFVKNHCPGKVATFILQASTNDTGVAVGASMTSAKGTRPPQLVLSDQDRFDWTYVDTLIGWAEDAGIKLEPIWFGSDSTGVTMDSRVPYFAFLNTKNEKVNSDGSHTPAFSKNTDPAYGVYWYFLDKNDLTTRAQEKRAIKEMMNHIASYNSAHGNKKTVIGIDVANEPAIQKFHGSSFTAWHNPKTWAALSQFASVQDFVDRTMWEYCINLANGVKKSNYPIWTRSNDFRGVDAAHSSYNENQRPLVGTSLDFVGYDPYSDSFTSAFDFGHAVTWDNKLFARGDNFPMIMENGGQYTTGQGLLLATLAGGATYNVYDYMSSDNFGLYEIIAPVAHGSYVQDVINTNNMLLKISEDLATKAPRAAGGTDLDFLNIFWNQTSVSSSFGKVGITYKPSNYPIVGIVDIRSSKEVALLSTGTATHTLSGITTYGISSVQSGYYSGSSWVKDSTVSYTTSGTSITFSIGAYEAIRVVTNNAVS